MPKWLNLPTKMPRTAKKEKRHVATHLFVLCFACAGKLHKQPDPKGTEAAWKLLRLKRIFSTSGMQRKTISARVCWWNESQWANLSFQVGNIHRTITQYTCKETFFFCFFRFKFQERCCSASIALDAKSLSRLIWLLKPLEASWTSS